MSVLSFFFTKCWILLVVEIFFRSVQADCDPDTLARFRLNAPATVRIGGVFPKLNYDGSGTANSDGVQYIAAFLMAIREINNKTDGQYDCLLPYTNVEFAIRESKGPFIDDIRAAIALCTTVFNNTGVAGTVGAQSNSASNAIAQIFNGYKMNQIAYGSTGSFLSYVGPYPYYLRTCVDDAFEGYAIADIINKYFKWELVSTFATTDSYGSDGITQFTLQAQAVGINIVSVHQFRSGIRDFSSIITDAKSRGTRIFVFFMSGTDAGRLLEQGYSLGLFTENTLVFGSELLSSTDVFNAMSNSAPVQDIMKGVMSLAQRFALDTPSLENWVSRWRNQPETVQIAYNGVETCVAGTDSDGGFDLYQGVAPTPIGDQNVCAGLKFSNFQPDGSDITSYAPFVYDATLALLQGLHRVIYSYGDDSIDGDVLATALTDNFTVNGITGPVAFKQGDPLTGFGYGDRMVGIRFQLMNFQPNLYCPTSKSGGFVPIGSWSIEESYVPFSDVTIIYNTGSGDIPADRPSPVYNEMSSSMSQLLIALACIALIIIFFFGFVLYSYRENKIVKSSQPPMMFIVLFGAVLACCRIFSGAQPVSTISCTCNVWFGHLAFFTVFGALMIKTWRVHIIVNTSMRRVKITTTDVLLIMIALIIAVIAYLIVMTVVGQPHMHYLSVDMGQLQIQKSPLCLDTVSQFSTTLFALEAVMMARGAHLCWLTKDVPDAVNDSKNIAMAMYSIIFICAMIFPIIFLINLDPSVVSLISGIGFAIATMSSLIAVFGMKSILLFQGANLDAKMGIVLPSGKGAGSGDAKVTDKTENLDVPMYEQQAHIKFSKGHREDNIRICREQIVKWQKLLLQLENRGLMSTSSGNPSSSQGTPADQGLSAQAKAQTETLERHSLLESHVIESVGEV